MIQNDNTASVALANKHWRAQSKILWRMITALPARWCWKKSKHVNKQHKKWQKIFTH